MHARLAKIKVTSGRRKNGSRDVLVPISGTYESVLLCGKGEFRVQMEIRAARQLIEDESQLGRSSIHQTGRWRQKRGRRDVSNPLSYWLCGKAPQAKEGE